jgi:hypothetical protein
VAAPVERTGAAEAAPVLSMVMPLLERIPDYADFPTVDEMVAAVHRLHERHPEITQLRRVGSSRLGEPLH